MINMGMEKEGEEDKNGRECRNKKAAQIKGMGKEQGRSYADWQVICAEKIYV